MLCLKGQPDGLEGTQSPTRGSGRPARGSKGQPEGLGGQPEGLGSQPESLGGQPAGLEAGLRALSDMRGDDGETEKRRNGKPELPCVVPGKGSGKNGEVHRGGEETGRRNKERIHAFFSCDYATL